MRPVAAKYPVTLGYRQKARFDPSYIHRGVDYGCPSGTPVVAATAGTVVHAGRGGMGPAFGIHVVLKTGATFHIYAHLSSESVSVGQKIAAGQRVGKSGATGNVTGNHLHYGEFTAYHYKSDRKPQFLDEAAPPPASTDKMDPAAYFIDATGPHVVWLGERLVVHGFDDAYKSGPGPTFSEADRKNVEDFQLAQGWTGDGADGFPGAQTLALLAADPVVEIPPKPAEPEPARILPRSEWTPSENGRAGRPLDPTRVTAFTVHYPGDGDVSYRGLSESEVGAKLRAYREHHVARGWADIGYNYAIDQSGRTWFLTGDTVGAHSGTVGNPSSIGVLFVIGNNESPTPAAVAAFRSLRAEKLRTFSRALTVQGHQEVPGNQTACPGPALMALVRAGTLAADLEPAPEPEPDVPSPEPVRSRRPSLTRPRSLPPPSVRCASTSEPTTWADTSAASTSSSWCEQTPARRWCSPPSRAASPTRHG